MDRHLSILFFFLCFVLYAQKSDFESISFNKADSIAHVFENSSLNNLPWLAYNLTNNLDTQVEKFRALHTWVSSNIKSDHSFSEKTIRKRKKFKNDSVAFSEWNAEVQKSMFEKLLKDKKTICSGYAYLLKELSTLVDIDCEIVDGYSRTVSTNANQIDIPNHSWNAVRLNNKWYLVDVTLASGYFFVNENKFIKSYNDGYFLADPELFSKNHYPLDKKWLLLESQSTLNQFVKTPFIYGNTFKYGIVPMAPKKLVTKVSEGENVVFSIGIFDKIKIDKIDLIIRSGLKYKKMNGASQDNENGVVNFKHNFFKKGTYDVQIEVNNEVVVSYVVEVEKLKNEL